MIEAKEKYGVVTIYWYLFKTIVRSGVLLGFHVNNTKTPNGYVPLQFS